MCAIHSLNLPRWSRLLLAPALALGLAACGGSGGGSSPTPTPTASYTVGGTLSGLSSGAQVQLLDNGGDALTLSANGSFQFATSLQQGTAYAVTVGTQPTGETCSVANATGSAISANVTNVTVTCSPNAYTVGGTVTGLASGQQVTLVDNGTDSLVVSANGNFQFTGQIAQAGSYSVMVGTQPAQQLCTVTNGTGANVTANVSNVTVACAAHYAYTVSNSSGALYQYAINGDGSLSALSPATLTAGTNPVGLVMDPAGRYVYAAGQGNTTIYQYSVGSNGVLSANGTISPSNAPSWFAIDGTGKYLYSATNTTSANIPISQFSIGSTGTLSALSPATVAQTGIAVRMAADPKGPYLYVANSSTGQVMQYTIGSTGALTPMSPSTVGAGIGAGDVAVDPLGRYAYAMNQTSNSVSQYTIGSTGALTLMTPNTVAAGGSPFSMAIDPTGSYAYVSNLGNGTVSQYTIGATGGLTPMSTPTVSAGSAPRYLAVDPTGTYLFVTTTVGSNGAIAVFSIGASGALTPVTGSPFTTGVNPEYIVVH